MASRAARHKDIIDLQTRYDSIAYILLRQKIASKSVQHDYFSSFNQSNQ